MDFGKILLRDITSSQWRKTLDEGDETGAVLTELSKAFDCIDHNSFMGKPNLMHRDLKKGRASLFILTSLSVNKEPKLTLIFRERSILRPLLFNIYICDMFSKTPENIDFAEYANDNTLYTYSSKIEHVLTDLQGASEKLLHWFSTNH